ncbi:MAG: hypothetical protein ACR2HR_07080 [Euzebya sp.]
MANEPRGAGTAGGLLFLAVAVFIGYLAITTIAGVLKWLLGVAFVVIIIALAIRLLSRR